MRDIRGTSAGFCKRRGKYDGTLFFLGRSRCRTVLSIPPIGKEHEQKVFASRWDELKEEDAPLRVLINGCLVGVKEDFYDFLIRRELPEGEIIQARLIGNLLLKYPLGISDSWYMNRINHMIETGEIEVVKEADEIFRRSIRKEQ